MRVFEKFEYNGKQLEIVDIVNGSFGGENKTLVFYKNSKGEVKVKTQKDFMQKFGESLNMDKNG